MHPAFGIVIWVVCIAGLIIGVVALLGTGKTWEEFGKNALLMERDLAKSERSGGAGSAASLLERDSEIRQMLEARNARRLRRGEEPLDIDAELRRLTAPAIDAGLREEIRELVIARNHRRARLGKPPLDVESEIEREIEHLQTV
jgi:hypothetical protein